MKFAHIADIHLGYEQYNQIWRAEDFSASFRKIAERSIEEDVDFVIIAGDLFHRSVPSPKTIKEAIEILQMFKRENIPVFAIEGNHDKTSRDISAYHLLESIGMLNVLGLRKKRVEGEYLRCKKVQNVYLVKGQMEDVEILGDRHRSRWQLEKIIPLLKPESENSVLVLHQAVKEVVDIDLDMAYDLTITDLPEAGYYAFGHIHLPRMYEFRGRYIVYPGSVERYDLREASVAISYKTELTVREGVRKGFVIVDDFKPEFIEIDTREMYDVEIEAENADELEKRFLEVMEKIGEDGILIVKMRCPEIADIKKMNEVALKRASYAEIRFERRVEDFEVLSVKSENEFFTDFELKLLDLLKGEIDEREVYDFLMEHYLRQSQEEVRHETEEKTVEDAKGIDKKPKTLLDFFGGD
ncbi:DNA repair exonuclease [Archaeoglobus neptunius]|uniref:DNA repair exonuclease n=1 Tax=Archaeoglobus neptunius TaxID=2798580 RepID=UPI001925678D|nr:exonuclease SbcCD subunit D [Archaeoglobus neptunius]